MKSQNLVILADRSCTDIYDYSISDKADVILEDFADEPVDYKYVRAVDLHADLFVDTDEETVMYFLENGIAAILLP